MRFFTPADDRPRNSCCRRADGQAIGRLPRSQSAAWSADQPRHQLEGMRRQAEIGLGLLKRAKKASAASPCRVSGRETRPPGRDGRAYRGSAALHRRRNSRGARACPGSDPGRGVRVVSGMVLPRGVASATRPEAGFWADLTRGKNLLAKFGDVREAQRCHTLRTPRFAGYAGPPLRGVLLWWLGFSSFKRLHDAPESLRARVEGASK